MWPRLVLSFLTKGWEVSERESRMIPELWVKVLQ